MTTTCNYRHDLSAEYFDDNDASHWECPHPADGDYCVFHGEASDEARKCRLLEAINESNPDTNRFLSATFGAIELDYQQLNGPTNTPIDCRDATFDALSWQSGSTTHPIDLRGSTITGPVIFDETRFTRRVDLGHGQFDAFSMRLAQFESWLNAEQAVFEGAVCGRVGRFVNGIYCVNAEFDAAADFTNAQFEDVANFYRTQFNDGAWFKRADFADKARFEECTLKGPAVEFGSVAGNTLRDRPTANGAAGMFLGIDSAGPLLFNGATLDSGIRIDDATLADDIECTDLTVSEDVVTIDLTETEHVSGTVTAADGQIRYDLSRAVLGDLELTSDTKFNAMIFDQTVFDGFDFTRYRKALTETEYQLHSPDDPSSVREVTYVRAKNGAKQVGDNRGAAEFFLREMVARRGGHRREFHQSSGTARLRHGGRYLGNLILEVTCGYGERPLWTVLSSVAIIAAFTVLYAIAGVPLSIGQSGVSYLTFSIQSFVSLVLGGPTVDNTFVSLIAATEGFLGGFMIALFVFTLTRSINR